MAIGAANRNIIKDVLARAPIRAADDDLDIAQGIVVDIDAGRGTVREIDGYVVGRTGEIGGVDPFPTVIGIVAGTRRRDQPLPDGEQGTQENSYLLAKFADGEDFEFAWYHVDVPAGVLRAGPNELGLISSIPAGGPFAGLVGPPGADPAEFLKSAFGRVEVDTTETPRPVVVHQIFVAATYPEG